jgi:hypothetical protein
LRKTLRISLPLSDIPTAVLVQFTSSTIAPINFTESLQLRAYSGLVIEALIAVLALGYLRGDELGDALISCMIFCSGNVARTTTARI